MSIFPAWLASLPDDKCFILPVFGVMIPILRYYLNAFTFEKLSLPLSCFLNVLSPSCLCTNTQLVPLLKQRWSFVLLVGFSEWYSLSIKCLLRAGHRAECFTDTLIFRPHYDSVWSVLLSPLCKCRSPESVSGFFKVTQLVMAEKEFKPSSTRPQCLCFLCFILSHHIEGYGMDSNVSL